MLKVDLELIQRRRFLDEFSWLCWLRKVIFNDLQVISQTRHLSADAFTADVGAKHLPRGFEATWDFSTKMAGDVKFSKIVFSGNIDFQEMSRTLAKNTIW